MDVIIDEIKAFPELKSYILVNLDTNEERAVTMNQLVTAFGPQLPNILNGRSNYWLVIEQTL